MNFSWKGVFPALTTKFTQQDELDLGLHEINVNAQIEAGVHGFILGGSLGEASTITRSEKETLTKNTLEICNGRLPVIVNIAEGATKDAVSLVKEAEKWGAHGFMLLPPMRYKSDVVETVTYFKSVAAATDLPIMIYNNPHDYKIEVTLDMFEQLAAFPHVNAVKDSSRDVTNVTRMINRFGDRFKILNGVDTLALESLSVGADGWVAGLVCAFPAETVKLYNLIKEQNLVDARKLYQWFMPLLELDIHPKLVQYIKLAEQEKGLGSEWVRAPRLPLTGDERKTVLEIIRKAIADKK